MTQAKVAGDSCSVLHDLADVPAVGTAAQARAWVAVQQNGPWGRLAPTQSHLDPQLGAALEQAADEVGARLALIRDPASHADDGSGMRRVFIAGGLDQSTWLVTGEINDPAQLLNFDWSELLAPTPEGVIAAIGELAPTNEPVLLVCTNGKRDVCCAVRGRPVAVGAAAERPGLVWETNHTGGHRYAPTGVLLPSGTTLARLDVPLAVLAVDAAQRGEIAPQLLDDSHHRGRSSLAPQGQAAEHFIRQLVGDLSLGGFTTTVGSDGLVEVTRTGGHTWLVDVTQRGDWPDLPASCGKESVPVHDWEMRVVPSA